MNSKFRKNFLTADVGFAVLSDEPVGDSSFFPLFLTDDEDNADVTVKVVRGALPAPGGETISKTDHRTRIVSDGTIYDYTAFADAPKHGYTPYACCVRRGDDVTLYIDWHGGLWDTMIFDALNVYDLLLANGAAVVHASFIRVGDNGIVFAGEKQQGKSTQARLWSESRGAEILNGDRVAIRGDGDGFTAHGIPFCGSSMVCVNSSAPLSAMVFPEKGPENKVAVLSAFESFKRLIGCLSYTRDDPEMRDAAIAWAERIASCNRCLLLSCRPDEGAVEALERELDI